MKLTAERLREVLRYCPDTGLFYWRERRGSVVAGSQAGVVAHDGAVLIRVDRKLYRAHRMAWLYIHGEWPREEIDHINGKPADNRAINLRGCTRAENTRNVRVHRDNESGLKGAYRDKRGSGWFSRICRDGKQQHIGTFATAAEAGRAYDSAALSLHGQFARPNGRQP